MQDRAEKLAIARVLDEVTVRFIGRDCEDVVWPVLHPGEPAVVWVPQQRTTRTMIILQSGRKKARA